MDQSPYSMAIDFENNNGTTGTYNIRFYSNGTRDNSSDFTQATALLSPTFKIIEVISKETFDVWGLINWYFVSCYWTFLYQFGDIAPTIYQQANNGGGFDIINGQININGMGYPNFSAPITSLPTTSFGTKNCLIYTQII